MSRYETDAGDFKFGTAGRDLAIVVAAIMLFLTCWPFKVVPTGSRGVLTQFGAIKSIEPEGLAIIPPWQRIDIFSIRAETSTINGASGATLDVQKVDTDLTVRYSIDPQRVNEVFEKYTHTGDLGSYVETATMEVFKAVTARYTAVDLVGKRAQVSGDILTALKAKLDVYGALVINVDMRNFEFQKAYMDAILEKVTQEQKKLAADNAAMTVASEQKQVVIKAEAAANAVKAAADGNAYATLTNAKAQAEALRLQNDALAQNKSVLDLRRVEVELAKAQKWNGVLPVNVYASAPIPFIEAPKP